MTVVTSLPSESELDHTMILNIFSSIGRCRFIDEKHFDACTALSGSGPAFACIFLEAMADGGVMMGLPRAEALELAAQSELVFHIFFRCLIPTIIIALQGTARMALQQGAHPAQIRDTVTSMWCNFFFFFGGGMEPLISNLSPWRMYNSRVACIRRRSSEVDYRSCYSNSY